MELLGIILFVILYVVFTELAEDAFYYIYDSFEPGEWIYLFWDLVFSPSDFK